MPAAPLMEPVVTLLLGQAFVSGYLPLRYVSSVSLFCCAVCEGLEGPLPIVTEAPWESISVIVSLSLFATNQPDGTVTDRLEFDAVPAPDIGLCDAIGLGLPAGVGLGKPIPAELDWPDLLALKMANAVPHAPMTSTRPTTALRIITHGARWTGACTTPGSGV